MLVAWERSDESRGHSLARVEATDGGWTAHGTEVLAGPGAVLSCSFRVVLDARWHTRRVEVTTLAADGERHRLLVTDGEGHWLRDGAPDAALDGCLDVDVAATPLTNTFPIRRLGHLEVGAAVTLAMAWVDVPSLDVTLVEQTYTRLGDRSWRYHDDEHGSFELSVDDDGIVDVYEGFARRVWP